MGLDINQELLKLQKDFIEDIREKGNINPKMLISIMFDLIKKKINFGGVI